MYAQAHATEIYLVICYCAGKQSSSSHTNSPFYSNGNREKHASAPIFSTNWKYSKRWCSLLYRWFIMNHQLMRCNEDAELKMQHQQEWNKQMSRVNSNHDKYMHIKSSSKRAQNRVWVFIGSWKRPHSLCEPLNGKTVKLMNGNKMWINSVNVRANAKIRDECMPM